MFTIEPPSAPSMCRAASWQQKKTLPRLSVSVRSHSSAVNSSESFAIAVGALLTSTSRRPQASSAALTSSRALRARERSAGSPTAFSPSSPTTASTALLSRALTTTRAPEAARRPAIALPIPRVEPVTRATLPRSDSDIWLTPLRARPAAWEYDSRPRLIVNAKEVRGGRLGGGRRAADSGGERPDGGGRPRCPTAHLERECGPPERLPLTPQHARARALPPPPAQGKPNRARPSLAGRRGTALLLGGRRSRLPAAVGSAPR